MGEATEDVLVTGHPDLAEAKAKHKAVVIRQQAAVAALAAYDERLLRGDKDLAASIAAGEAEPDYDRGNREALIRRVRTLAQAADLAKREIAQVRHRLVTEASARELPNYLPLVDRTYAAAVALVAAQQAEQAYFDRLTAGGLANPAGWSRVFPYFTRSDLVAFRERIVQNLRRHEPAEPA